MVTNVENNTDITVVIRDYDVEGISDADEPHTDENGEMYV